MYLAPLRDDASATTYHARQSLRGEVHVLQTYPTMYGEIIDTLLTLFYQDVSEQLPSEVFCLAVHLLHRLIHRHSANRDGTVTQDPFTRLVYVVACR